MDEGDLLSVQERSSKDLLNIFDPLGKFVFSGANGASGVFICNEICCVYVWACVGVCGRVWELNFDPLGNFVFCGDLHKCFECMGVCLYFCLCCAGLCFSFVYVVYVVCEVKYFVWVCIFCVKHFYFFLLLRKMILYKHK